MNGPLVRCRNREEVRTHAGPDTPGRRALRVAKLYFGDRVGAPLDAERLSVRPPGRRRSRRCYSCIGRENNPAVDIVNPARLFYHRVPGWPRELYFFSPSAANRLPGHKRPREEGEVRTKRKGEAKGRREDWRS